MSTGIVPVKLFWSSSLAEEEEERKKENTINERKQKIEKKEKVLGTGRLRKQGGQAQLEWIL
jgi:hypothetical protein